MNLQEVRKNLGELREGLRKIRTELNEHFADVEANDRYSQQMWQFSSRAASRLADLVDDVNTADTTYADVVKYFGEDDKNMNSAEFYGITYTLTERKHIHAPSPSSPPPLLSIPRRLFPSTCIIYLLLLPSF